MRRVFVAGLLGGLAAFAWGALSWGVLPLRTAKFVNIPDEAAVIDVLKGRLGDEGVYHYPGFPRATATAAQEAEWRRRLEMGPLVPMLVYLPSGARPFGVALIGELLMVVGAATIAAWLLSLAAPSLRGFTARAGFVAAIGVVSAIVTHGADWNWSSIPSRYALIASIDLMLEWVLVGLVLAWRLAPADARHTIEMRTRATVA